MFQVATALFLLAVCQAAPQLHHVVNPAHHVSTVHVAAAPVHHLATPVHHVAAPVHHVAAPVHHVAAAPVHHVAAAPVHHVVTAPHHTGTVLTHPAPVRYATADHAHAHVAVVDESPKPYAYGYESPADGGSSSKEESSDGTGRVTGSYSVTDEDGRYRKVEYYADETGFHANIQTNEPGTANQNPADVQVESTAVNEPVVEPHVVHHAPAVHVQPAHHVAHHPTVVHRRIPVVAPHAVHHPATAAVVIPAAAPHVYSAHHGHALGHQPVVLGGHHVARVVSHPLHHRQLVPVIAHH